MSSGGATLISQPSSASSTSPSTSRNSETAGSEPDIVDIAREAQRGMIAAVCACDKKMFSMTGVIGLVWNNIFGSMISQTTFYRKLLITCRLINVISLYMCIAR